MINQTSIDGKALLERAHRAHGHMNENWVKTITLKWRNVGTVTPAMPGATRKGAPNDPRLWDNFAKLKAQLAKSLHATD